MHVSYVSTLLVSCAPNSHCLLVRNDISHGLQGLLLSTVGTGRLTDVCMHGTVFSLGCALLAIVLVFMVREHSLGPR